MKGVVSGKKKPGIINNATNVEQLDHASYQIYLLLSNFYLLDK